MLGSMSNDLIDGSLNEIVKLTHIALLKEKPGQFSDIARYTMGDAALTSSNFEIVSANSMRRVKVKSVPSISISGTTGASVTAKYVALYTDASHWMTIDTNQKPYLVGATARINDFDIDLSYPASPLKMSDTFMDGGLDKIKDDSTQLLVMKVVPTQAGDITAGNTLVTITMSASDFSLSGSGGTRKLRVGQKLSGALTAAGTIKSVVLRKDANNTEWLSSTVANVSANAGDTVQVNPWDIKFIPTTSMISTKPAADSADLEIDTSNPIAENLAYFTIDFKADLVASNQNPQAIFDDTDSRIDEVTRDLIFATHGANRYYFGDRFDEGYLSQSALTLMLKLTSDFKSAGDLFSIGGGVYLRLGDRILQPSKLYFGDGYIIEIPSLSDGRFDEGNILTITYGHGMINIYTNSERIAQKAVDDKRTVTGDRPMLGGESSFAGDVEFAAIWNRELSGNEVATMATSPYLLIKHRDAVPPEIVINPAALDLAAEGPDVD